MKRKLALWFGCMFLLAGALALTAGAKGEAFEPIARGETCRVSLGALTYELPSSATRRVSGVLTQMETKEKVMYDLDGMSSRDRSACRIIISDDREIRLDRDRAYDEYFRSTETGFYYDCAELEIEWALRRIAEIVQEYPPQFVGSERMHVFSADGFYSVNAPGWEWALGEPELDGKLGKALTDLDRVEYRDEVNWWKTSCELFENGMRITHTFQGNLDDPFSYTQTIRDLGSRYGWHLKQIRAAYRDGEKNPSWLGIANPDKVTDIRAYEKDGKEILDTASTSPWSARVLLDGVNVQGSAAESINVRQAKLANARRFEIDFRNGIRYTVYYTNTLLTITSSDVPSRGIRYVLKDTCALDDFCKPEISKPNPGTEYTKPDPGTGKPVIYLYPEREQQVHVALDFTGTVDYTYPDYGTDGWTVTARPDGRLTDENGEYYYLFWEGTASVPWECERGACVPGAQTESYLRGVLANMGLTPREYNDFITYWVPKMKDNPYNLISFSETQYDEVARLTVTPRPDSILRVHMVWKALQQPVEVAPQVYHGFERKGFTVVEWGGTKID